MGRSSPRSAREIGALEDALGERGLLASSRALCRAYNVTLPDVLAMDKTTRVAHARDALACMLLDKGFSTTETGKLLGMHHTSIIAARDRHKKRAAIEAT